MTITKIPAQQENRKTRIAVYCRVSTKREEQEDSLAMQREAYISVVSLHPDYELAGVYADSLSGLSAEKRPEFMEMIHAALDGGVDRILCKSISRFSRNFAECKKYTDMLLQKNIAVEFEKEGIVTDDPTSTFLFSLMSAVAEFESRSISENVRWGQQERVKRGEYNLGNNRILGYDCVDGKLVPNADAWIIKLMFRLYAEGATIPAIQKKLAEMGVLSNKGLPISYSTIKNRLKNETYRGDKLLQKQPPKQFLTHKPDPDAEYVSNYLVNDHEAIVDDATWNAVQERLGRNTGPESRRGEEPCGAVKEGSDG